MQYHDSTSVTVRQEVVSAVALYAQRHEVQCIREIAPGAYTLRHRHDRDGHADERVFLAAIAAHPAVARVEPTTHAEDEVLGVDALVTVCGVAVPVPIDVTTRGRGCRGYIANLLDTLRRGVVPVVIERVPTDLAPDDAFAAFAYWWQRSEEYFHARPMYRASGDTVAIVAR